MTKINKIVISFLIFLFVISCSNSNKKEEGVSIFINTGPEPNTIEEIKNPEKLLSLTSTELLELDLVRQYFGNTTPEMQALRDGYSNMSEWIQGKPKIRITDSEWTWIEVDKTIKDWIRDFKECVSYGFMITNASGWNEFREKVMYGRIK